MKVEIDFEKVRKEDLIEYVIKSVTYIGKVKNGEASPKEGEELLKFYETFILKNLVIKT